ncbi:AMIN domain-containing protein, partial [Ralstonia pseudosolanacearum]|uniref:AMIN domain-containing protein n=1 Tax=Ralstonia pseudosolanacearum TaxID=1310165 RepID=UPI003CEDBD42
VVDFAGATLPQSLRRRFDVSDFGTPPQTLRELRDAALADEHGNQLRACLQRHAFSVEG